MELRQLVYFVTVAEELSFRRAADRLHIVQPSVSQQVRRLESELGSALFERTSRRVALTAAGERLLPEARTAIAAVERVRSVAAELSGGATLRLGTSQGMGERLADVLERLRHVAPALRVELVGVPVDRRLAMVRDGGLDAAFVRAVAHSPGLDVVPLWSEALAAVVPAGHPIAVATELQLADVATLPLRLAPREENAPFVDLIMRAFDAAGTQPRLGPTFTNAQDTIASIAAGSDSWTVMYERAARPLGAPRVAVRRLAGVTAPTSLAVRAGARDGSLRRLLDACRAVD